MEIELKLLLDPAGATAFRRHPLLHQQAIAKPRVQQLNSIYFGTPNLHFLRHNAALWVRLVNHEWIQALKGEGQVAVGLHERLEWGSCLGGAHPDLLALSDLVGHGTTWAKILAAVALTDQLAPICNAKFRRTLWQLLLTHGGDAELALDQKKCSTVQHGCRSVRSKRGWDYFLFFVTAGDSYSAGGVGAERPDSSPKNQARGCAGRGQCTDVLAFKVRQRP